MSFYQDFNDKTVTEAWSATAREPYQTLQLTRLAPTLGAEVRGVDLSKDVPDAQFAEIQRALRENLVPQPRD